MGGNNSNIPGAQALNGVSPQQALMMGLNPGLYAQSTIANKGLAMQREPELARKRRLLRREYEPQAESAALQSRQMSIAGGTTGGAGFSSETQAYEEIMKRLAQAIKAYEQQLQQRQIAALGTVGQVAGTVGGGIYGGPPGAAAGGAFGAAAPGAFLSYGQPSSGGY